MTHGKPIHGNEPTMQDYFFERIRPLMEATLREGDHRDWPLVTLNLDSSLTKRTITPRIVPVSSAK